MVVALVHFEVVSFPPVCHCRGNSYQNFNTGWCHCTCNRYSTTGFTCNTSLLANFLFLNLDWPNLVEIFFRSIPLCFWFLSPPVHFARWAHMRCCQSVRLCGLDQKYLTKNHICISNTGRGLSLWQRGLIANVKLHFLQKISSLGPIIKNHSTRWHFKNHYFSRKSPAVCPQRLK